MVALFLEAYGAVCLFSLIAFLIWAAVAKLRPDLDEEEFEELEKLKKLVGSEPSEALPDEEPILKELARPKPARPVKSGEYLIRGRPHLIRTRRPRTT